MFERILLTPCSITSLKISYLLNDSQVSCISQLLSVTHEIYESFDCNPLVDVRRAFLDISKAFDKVWYDGLIYKLKSYGAENKLLNLIQNYLTNRQQRVLINGWTSKWTNILAGIPQGSVLVPLLFSIYWFTGLESICKMFADDTSLFSEINDIDTSNIDINNNLVKISRWAYQWKMSFNPDINKQATEVYFSQRRAKSLPPPIIFNNNNVLTSPWQNHLGLVLDRELSFNEHVNQKINKCNRTLGLMKRLSLTLSRKQLLTIYKTFVRSHLDYADIIYDKPFNDSFKDKLEKVQ